MTGWICIAQASSLVTLSIGGFIQGLSDALCVTPSLLFASEISHVTYRGIFLNSGSVMANVGVPFAFIVGGLLSWYQC